MFLIGGDWRGSELGLWFFVNPFCRAVSCFELTYTGFFRSYLELFCSREDFSIGMAMPKRMVNPMAAAFEDTAIEVPEERPSWGLKTPHVDPPRQVLALVVSAAPIVVVTCARASDDPAPAAGHDYKVSRKKKETNTSS